MQLVWDKKQICSMAIVCTLVLMAGGMACTPMTTTDPPPAQALDADADGVADKIDQCADTPANTAVDATGCPSRAAGTDADGDGVSDANDACANTPANTSVDMAGCAVGGPDADGDGVLDANDNCDNTATGASVDLVGCAASERDTDMDGVFDDVDECPNTDTSATIDAVGCPVSAGGPDTDGDGVNDDIDLCMTTPAGEAVDANGCAASERDTDMDGVVDSVDQCMNTLRGTTVDATGCPQVPTGGDPPNGPGSVCGNSVVESGEQCDPPNGTTCDANCQTTAGGALTNDSCMTPIAVGEGDRTFSNTNATTDGPDEPDAPATCNLGNYTHVESDIWYLYTSTCPNLVVVSLCGSLYDTKMMIYDGSGCPADAVVPFACSDDDCGAIANSRTIFTAVTGQQYLIRIGGFQGEQGDGTLTIYCGNDPGRGPAACGIDAGTCFASNGTPGCDDVAVCNQLCQVDPFCCDTEWDQTCAAKADGIVNGFPACTGSTNVCNVAATAGGGCDVQTCCQSICEQDAFCCNTLWDSVCADRAATLCP